MNKFSLALITGVFLLVLLSAASAATINGQSNLSMCQCETVNQVYSVCADTTGTYNFSVQGNAAGWFSIAPQTLNLTAGSCQNVYVFVTPICYATSGLYSAELKLTGIENATRSVSVNVNQCHTFDYTVSPASNSSAPCENNVYNVYAKNTGKFSDEFVLMQNGLNDSWVTYPRESFVLSAGGEIATQVIVNSACSATAGNYPFALTLSNTMTNAAKTINLSQGISSFIPFNHTLSTNISSCEETGKDFSFYLSNVSSKADEFTFSLSASDSVSLNKTKIDLGAGETGEVVLSVKATPAKTEYIGVIVHSKNYDTDYNLSVKLDVLDCYNLSIEKISSQGNICLGVVKQNFNVTNTGTDAMTLTVSATGIPSDQKQITLIGGASQTVELTFSPTGAGQANVIVTADSGYTKKSVEYILTAEDCYGSKLVVPSISACQGTTMYNSITVRNNGTKVQTYDLSINASWIALEKNSVTLQPQTQENISLTLNVPQTLVADNYQVIAKSDNAEINRTLAVAILPTEECYSFITERTGLPIDVNCCSGEITELKITNNGYFAQTINLSKIAPPWVAFSESQVALNVGETKLVYVYFSPPAGTNGIVDAQILLNNAQNVSKTIDFNLNVFGGNCGVALSADIDVNNQIANTATYTRKEVEVEFVVTNDSNVGFNILDMNVNEYSSTFQFERGIYLEPGQSVKAKMVIGLGENPLPQTDVDVNINVITSVGTFTKVQRVNLSESNNAEQAAQLEVTGLFLQYFAPAIGVLLLILILVAIIVVAKKATNPPKKSKK